MILPRGPLIRVLIALWCVIGAYTFTADAMLFSHYFTEDIILLAQENDSMDEGEKTGTAEIRLPHLSVASVAARNPLGYDTQADRPTKTIAKPHRLSHMEYCPKKMVRAIMLQFHPRE